MAITNATRLSDFAAGIGTEGAILKIDNANQRVGIGTQLPSQMLEVAGIVTATAFHGDGSNLEGITSAGLGTAIDETEGSVGAVVYYTDDLLTVAETTTINPPASASAAYTQYRDVKLEDNVDLIIETGDDFIPDVLGFGTDSSDPNAAGNGVFDEVYSDIIKNKDGLGAPTFANGLTSVGVITATGGFSGNVTGNVTGSVTGSGANLTNLPAGQLTGALPAISGANLTGIDAAPSVSGISSGAISAGAPVMMNADGKLSAVNGVSSLKATTTPYVADTSADGAGLEYMSLVYDPVNDQYICVYHTSTGSPSHHIKAKVGQVSGTTITWGAAQTICAGNSDQPRALWDTVNNKLIVMYRATSDSNKGKCKVCSVSGTTITPGAESGDFTNGTELTRQTFVHDPVEDKIVFFWENNSAGKTRVGEVNPSNDTITFPGSQGEYCPSRAFIPVAIFVPGPNKVVVSFMHYTASEKGAIVAGTVSGNNVTFGTIQYYETAYQNGSGLSYDSVNSRVLISWACGSTGQYLPKARTATLSGTTFTFATTHNLQSPNGTQGSAEDPAICFDPTSKKALSIWTDTGNSNSQLVATTLTINPLDGSLTQNTATQITTGQTIQIMGIDEGENLILDPDTGIITYIWKDTNSSGQTPGIKYYTERLGSSNMNDTNFVGFSQAAYTNGQTAKVHVVGATSTNQTGLTTATKYFVLGDGSLSSTAGDPIVAAGFALSDTSLLIR